MAEKHHTFHHVREIFESLLDLSEAERARRLDELAAADDLLAAEVRRMLGWHQAAEGFLETPAQVAAPAPDPGPPELTFYRLTDVLGRGGMGSVYRAERSDGLYKKPVAVKVLDHSPDNRELAARFRAERQILAALEHPHIAKLLDGGAARDGRPYFVMELIEGEPIDRYCDRHRLGVRERLHLFLEVCSAVSFAHRHLVVHRDLKPGNILVDKDGSPRLLDFGIAKLLTPEALDLTVMPTEHGFAPLTPEYASPEQVSSRPISALSDVYSLGVLLYLLLTGRRPYALAGLRFDQLVQVIAEHEPERPSKVVTQEKADGPSADELAAARGTDARTLARRLAGDLDTVVGKALRKEPERRYSSVEQLAADLEAYLDGRPVRARPDTFGYRAGKFLLRHRWAASVAAVALATLLGLLAVLAQQRLDLLARQAELIRERNRAEAVSGFLTQVFAMPDPAQARGREVSARELLDNGVAEIDHRLADQPGARADLLLTMARSYKNLGLYEESAPLLAAAVGLQRQEGGQGARLADGLHEQAEVASFAGRLAEAEELERQALVLRRSAGGAPDEALVEGLGRLGRILDLAGRTDEAVTVYQEAIGYGRTLAASNALATVLQRSAGVERRRDHRRKAEELLREALTLQRRELGADHPATAVTTNDLGLVLLELGRPDEAEPVLAATRELLLRLYPDGHPHLVTTLHNLGRLRAEQDRGPEAEALYRDAIATARKVYRGDHPLVATSLASFAVAAKRAGRPEEAEAHYREALAIERRLLPQPHAETAAKLNDLGLLLLERGRLDEAEPLLVEALEQTRQTLGPSHSQLAVVLDNLGYLAHQRGDLAAAQGRYAEALAVVRSRPEPRPQDLALALHNLGSLARDRGDLATAEQTFREALEVIERGLGADHLNAAMARLSLAEVRLKTGDARGAEEPARQALERLARAFPATDAWVLAARRVLGQSLLAQGRTSEAESYLGPRRPDPAAAKEP